MRARLFEQAIDGTEIELPFARFDEFPGCGGENRVESELAEQRPELLQVLQVGRGGIAELPAENQERCAVDDELLGRAFGAQVRWVAGRKRAGGGCCQHKRWQQPRAEYAGGQNVPRRPTNMVLPESNRLNVAFENC